ncbi:MAG: hypothetical protein IPI67_03830 [Myxococcales bacterium]|nr:hypothetical protein [Myxococcales bacterium]
MNQPLRPLATVIQLAALTLTASVARAETWSEVSTNNEACSHMEFIDDSTGFMGAPLKRTTDGGVTWTEITMPTGHFLSHFHFFDAQNAFIITSKPSGSNPQNSTWQTTDGGKNWTALQTAPFGAANANRLMFTSASNGYVVARALSSTGCTSPGAACDYVHKTTDGGKTWAPLDVTNYPLGFGSIFFATDSVFFKDGTGGIFRSDTGGTSWTFQYKDTVGIPAGVTFYDTKFGFANNSNLFQLMYTTNGGTTWTATKIGGANKTPKGYAFRDGTTAFALVTTNTNKREIWRTSDSGANWTQDTLPAGYELGGGFTCAAWPSTGVQYAAGSQKVLRIGTPTGKSDAGVGGAGGAAGGGGSAGTGGGSAGVGGGAAGAGGAAAGAGGVISTGGTPSTGGSPSTGGTKSSGGSDDGGCGCRAAGATRSGAGLTLLGLALLALQRRRRRAHSW